jgi:hypothetical protein
MSQSLKSNSMLKMVMSASTVSMLLLTSTEVALLTWTRTAYLMKYQSSLMARKSLQSE